MDFTRAHVNTLEELERKSAESLAHYKLSDEFAFLLSHPIGSI